MWRALVFIGLLCLGAFAAVWLADRPGDVLVTWGGYEARTTVAVAAVLMLGLAMTLAFVWAAVRALIGLPDRIGYASRARRRSRGYAAVSRGMVAVGAGDPVAARRHAGEAQRLLGRQPLTLLLSAQAAQISGDRPGAEAAFRRMAEDDETRVLGLRGLYVEARRRSDDTAARAYAQEAARLAPAVGWANEAVLEAQCADQDWRGALAIVERRASLGLLDKGAARRQRAVLLTADALARRERDPEGALEAAQDAVRLAPDLVPAAALAGQLLSRRGDLRRAARIVETAWKSQPHPDLADAYVNLRPGDSALDRLHRAETLAKFSSWSSEARLAVAQAALEAREFARAREVLRPVLEENPTVRACFLMADIEQAEHGSSGQVREWLARAARAPRDPVWMADGVVADRWAPVSPVSGRLDAFVWQAPPDVLPGPGRLLIDEDDVVADLDDKPQPAAAIAPAPAAASAHAADPASVPVAPAAPADAGDASAADASPVAAASVPVPSADAASASEAQAAEPKPVVFPVSHAPDDPGPRREEKPKLRVFG